MIAGLFPGAWLILWSAPDTSFGRFLQRWMLDRLIARAARITRGQVILTVLLFIAAGAAIWLLRVEAGPLLGLATPEIGYLFASFEVTTWLDAVSGAMLVGASVRWRGLPVARLLRRGQRPFRQRRSRSPIRRTGAPAKDDERTALFRAA